MGLIDRARVKSPWIMHFDCGGCNGCDIEVLACLTPIYDVERFGIVNVGNPKHADALVVTGPVNRRNAQVLRNVYEQMPEPRVVIAVGTCACSGGVFHNCYNILGGTDKVIPVDVYVPGCAAKPEAIIDGVVLALQKLQPKNGKVKPGKVKPEPTDRAEAPGEAEGELPTAEAAAHGAGPGESGRSS